MDDKKQEPLSEKGVEYNATNNHRGSIGAGRKNSLTPEVIAGEIFDERYERTQRGLKSRYVYATSDELFLAPSTVAITALSPLTRSQNHHRQHGHHVLPVPAGI
jgi:hypothetical protein